MKNAPSMQSRKPLPKYLAAGALSVVVFGLVMLTQVPGWPSNQTADANNFFYDFYYKLRSPEDQRQGPVVIVAADQTSMDAIDKQLDYGWPWPLNLWGHVVTYLSDSGAKAVVFDLLFTNTSTYNASSGDDDAFAERIKAAKCPVIFATRVKEDGSLDRFAPPILNPVLGVTNADDAMLRHYLPTFGSSDSLASAALKSLGLNPSLAEHTFLLHFFGPSEQSPFTYISADNVVDAQLHGKKGEQRHGISPDLFRGKIVLIGATAAGTYDLKSSPLSKIYPGVEMQATAIDDMLADQQVIPVARKWLTLLALLCTIAAAFGVIYPRRAWIKLLLPATALLLLMGSGICLFHRPDIRWLPPAESLLALLLATPMAFAYTYFVEDRQSRFMLEALSKVVSPAVAQTLSLNPIKLTRDTNRRLLTVLFTDLANFTSLSESMSDDNKKLVALLDDYLDAMSNEVIKENGTLDKYIGDSVMCFWNAPLEQADHAARACRAALAMQALKKEYAISVKGKEMKIYTRIGINTTLTHFGFVGSSHLMNYTVIGDGVNLASRLEGANKLYGTRILLAEDTAILVKSQFHLRRIDSLVVKGKTRPMDVYELLAERSEIEPPFVEKVRLYESALNDYQNRRWDSARQKFLALCERFGDDSSSSTFLKRIAAYRIKPPPADWDGAYGAEDK